jgi:hypothetical protein
MAVRVSLTEEEYLWTRFPGVDQEFREGEDNVTRQFAVYDRHGLHHVPEFQVPEANRPLRAEDIFD